MLAALVSPAMSSSSAAATRTEPRASSPSGDAERDSVSRDAPHHAMSAASPTLAKAARQPSCGPKALLMRPPTTCPQTVPLPANTL